MHDSNESELIRDDQTPQDEKPQKFYDAAAKNRFEYEVKHDGFLYDVAHVFGPITDERYLQWSREMKVSGNEQEISEETREAAVRLWDDLIVEVENIDYPPDADWKTLIDHQ
ncbi:MAG: hypothetical protein ABI539_15130, partial [Acidobacteriota bacterium]